MLMAEPRSAHNNRDPAMKGHGFAAAYSRFNETSYVLDYVGLGFLLGLDILLRLLGQPFHRMFSLDNHAIQFPHAESERVPPILLVVYAGGIPIVALAIWAALVRPTTQKLHVTYLSLLISIFLTVFITDVIKDAVGRPRPDLIARCKPRPETPLHTLVSYKVCTETSHHLLHDGWRSFPSGHSSFSFSGLGFLSIFLAGQLHVFHPRTPLPSFLLSICPFMFALLIAISRCEDYRHDVWDITVGSLIGLTIAYLSYRRFYPPLTGLKCATPYANLAESTRHLRDEEGRVGMRDSVGTTSAVSATGTRNLNEDYVVGEDGDDNGAPQSRLMEGHDRR